MGEKPRSQTPRACRSTKQREAGQRRAQEGRDLPNLLWPAPRPRPRLGRDGDVLCSSMWRTASNTALMLVERLSTRSYWCTTGATAPAPKSGGREVRCAARDGEARPSHECLTAAPRWRRHVRAWHVLVLVCRCAAPPGASTVDASTGDAAPSSLTTKPAALSGNGRGSRQ